MISTSEALAHVFEVGGPLVKQWLEVAEQITGLREYATANGLDWSQAKALLKAKVQDDMDESGEGKRVQKLLEKAEHASAYADILGMGTIPERKLNFQSQPSVASQAVERSAGDGPSQQTPPAAPIQEQASRVLSAGEGEPLTSDRETVDWSPSTPLDHDGPKSTDLAHSFEHQPSAPTPQTADQAAGVEPRIPPAADLPMDIPAFLRRSKQMETA